MKKVGAFLWVMVLLVVGIAWGGDWDGKCPVCKQEGQTSRVQIGMCTSTLMFCGNGEYDEQGRFVAPPDCNQTSCSYSCSNGHRFSEGVPVPRVDDRWLLTSEDDLTILEEVIEYE